MAAHLYLSMIPEALIASMLPPMDFGVYYAVGTEKKSRGQAQFFSVDRNFSSDYFPMSEIDSRCVPRADGQPKHSVYLSVYRVLEHLPLNAIQNLYLATRDGRVLEIAPSRTLPSYSREYRMYQEICPVTPRVVSSLDPKEFAAFMTDSKRSIHVPVIFFAELGSRRPGAGPREGQREEPSVQLHRTPARLREGAQHGAPQEHEDGGPHPASGLPVPGGPERLLPGQREGAAVLPHAVGRGDADDRHDVWWRSASL